LLTDEVLARVHNRGLDFVERQEKSFHCKTPDCNGWYIYEDEVCMNCNLLTCMHLL